LGDRRGQAASAPEASGFQQPDEGAVLQHLRRLLRGHRGAAQRYIEYIDEAYNAERLTQILTDVADIIGANILNVARQDYDPQGASVTILISEQPVIDKKDVGQGDAERRHARVGRTGRGERRGAPGQEPHHRPHLSGKPSAQRHRTFRADIDVATCGVISPLKALNYLIDSFESDIVVMDYRVRGFTRDVKGTKHYIDHKINSIQDFLSKPIKNRYEMFDVNVYQENIFHTKMHMKEFDLDTYLFEAKEELSFKDRARIEAQVRARSKSCSTGAISIDCLADRFTRIEIVSEKNEAAYARVLRECGVAPERFVMVGNSMRSDIEPVLRLGGWGVHVPYRLTWALEAEHTVDAGHARFCTVADAAGIPAALAGLGV
jgi:S-adenosylmethionine decarboxylase